VLLLLLCGSVFFPIDEAQFAMDEEDGHRVQRSPVQRSRVILYETVVLFCFVLFSIGFQRPVGWVGNKFQSKSVCGGRFWMVSYSFGLMRFVVAPDRPTQRGP